MGVAVGGGKISVTGTAQNLTTLLGLPSAVFISGFQIRADITNTDIIWVGKANVTATTDQLGFIQAGEALSQDTIRGFHKTDEVYLIATSGTQVAYVITVS